jgi:hypothetical protein
MLSFLPLDNTFRANVHGLVPTLSILAGLYDIIYNPPLHT